MNLPDTVTVKHFYKRQYRGGKLSKYISYTKLIDHEMRRVILAKAQCNLKEDVPQRAVGRDISTGRAFKAWARIRTAKDVADKDEFRVYPLSSKSERLLLHPKLYKHVTIEALEENV